MLRRVNRMPWRPLEHFTERTLLGLLVLAGLGAGFGTLLLLVRFRWTPLYRFDHGIAAWLNDQVAPHHQAVTVLKALSSLGGRPMMFWLVGVVVVALLIRKQHRLAVYLVVTGVGALILDPSLKLIVGRLRPVVDVPVASAPGNSFPSGHALGSIVAYGALLLVFLPVLSARVRRFAFAITALLVVSIGFTRMALGVHFLSDVLGGWLLGLAWLGVTARAFQLWRRESGDPVAELGEGLAPEAAADLAPAPDEPGLVPGPKRAAVAEILVGWVLVFGVLYVVGILASRYAGGTFVATLDQDVPQWLADRRTPFGADVSWYWSKAGDTHAILFGSLVFCPLMVALVRRWRPVLFIALAMFGELTLFLASAAVVDRPRPDVPHLDGHLPTSSFPSGHIAATMCLYAAIAVLVFPRTRQWWRWIPVVLAVVMPVGVALSRMYRGMHHPSDAFGAAVLTALWISLLYWVVRPNADITGPDDDTRGPDGRDDEGVLEPPARDPAEPARRALVGMRNVGP